MGPKKQKESRPSKRRKTQDPCDIVDGKVCCGGYIWDEAEKKCTRCVDGFYGINCDIPCPYPSFGWDCQSECSCGKEYCHHMYGCRQNQSDFSQLRSIEELSTFPVPASSTDCDEATQKSANILNMDKICAEDKRDVYKSNSASYIAGIISLLVVAGLLMVLYAWTFLHKAVCITQREEAINSTL